MRGRTLVYAVVTVVAVAGVGTILWFAWRSILIYFFASILAVVLVATLACGFTYPVAFCYHLGRTRKLREASAAATRATKAAFRHVLNAA